MRVQRRLSLMLSGVILGGLPLHVAALGQFGMDAPSARVVRLTDAEGYVHIDRNDGTAGDPAQTNMPLVEGQTVMTGEDGQAEVEFEDGSLARLTPNSSLVLARLTGDRTAGGMQTQLTLAHGLAYFELRAAPGIRYTVVAGTDRVQAIENATVRMNLDEAPAAIAVLSGTVHIERTGGYATDVRAGETFRGDPQDTNRYFLTQEVATDSWDQWNESRDQMAADGASQQTPVRKEYAGAAGYGWSDLDANGNWYDVAGQGPVWQPQGGQDASFDPYDNGSWVWYPVGSYVWASAYPWGWTPYRCGNWSYWSTFGWGWAPGASCASFGFGYGFGGGGFGGSYVNIVHGPRNYPPHRPPSPVRGGLHPIVTVRSEPKPLQSAPVTGSRTIAGTTAVPLRPEGASYTVRGGTAVGSALLRDYPVNTATHTAVLGVQPGQPGSRSFDLGAPAVYSVRGVESKQGLTSAGSRTLPPSGLRPGSYPAQPGMYPRSVTPSVGANAPRTMPTYAAPRPAPAASPRMSVAPPPAAVSHSAPAASVPSGKK